MDEDLIEQYRYFLKDSIRKEIDFSATDQNKGVDAPPIEKPYPADAVRIDLVTDVHLNRKNKINRDALILLGFSLFW